MGATGPHFSDAELACRHCGVNDCRQELVDALEELRAIAGVSIQVDSAFRCSVHNAAIGGVPDSQHVQGIAADIKIHGMTPSQMYAAAIQVPAFAGGGIGVSESQSGYIHVDTRGTEARWCYDLAGKQIPWNPLVVA